jgi:hypothetical protein
MKRRFPFLGTGLLVLYSWAALSGWDASLGAQKNTLPASARNAGGWRTYHFWSGGK